jgi:EAL domain-containing protein (putative c-di-GMP-specific phosphodiesterase class I)
LKVLPVDELKVDRSFVQGMTTNHSDAVLVQSAIDLGHNLGLSVVAEGVEDAATLEALRNCGADVIQGYFIGRPMPEHILTKWIAERTTPPGWPPASYGPRAFASLEPAGTTATPIPS